MSSYYMNYLTRSPPERKKRLCIVPVCFGERFDLVHKFPNDSARAERWRNILNVETLANMSMEQIRKRYFVCSRHFRISDYKNIVSRGLNKTAVPSINLIALDNLDIIERNFPPANKDEQHSVADFEKNRDPLYEEEYLEEVASSLTENQTQIEIVDADAGSKRKCDFDKSDDVITSKRPLNFKIDDDAFCDVERLQQEDEEEVEEVIEVEEQEELEAVMLYNVALNPDEDEVEPAEIQVKMTDEEVAVDPVFEITSENNEPALPNLDILEIYHPDLPKPIEVHNLWLRDHCRCEDCYDQETNTRKSSILDFPDNLARISCQVEENRLIIEWNDAHISHYDIDFLYQHQEYIHKKKLSDNRCDVFWDVNSIDQLVEGVASVAMNDYLCDDNVAKNVVSSLLKYGMAFIKKVPPNIKSTDTVIKRLFPIKQTHLGEIFLLPNPTTFDNHKSPHTSTAYLDDSAGLVALHCTQSPKSGGEFFFVDGFRIANNIQLSKTETSKRLKEYIFKSEFIDEENHFEYSGPVIKADVGTDVIREIRYDPSTLASHAFPRLQDQLVTFYDDFKCLATEVEKVEYKWSMELERGTVVIMNNRRILHGWRAFQGKRSVCCAYISYSDFMSKARNMKLVL